METRFSVTACFCLTGNLASALQLCELRKVTEQNSQTKSKKVNQKKKTNQNFQQKKIKFNGFTFKVKQPKQKKGRKIKQI